MLVLPQNFIILQQIKMIILTQYAFAKIKTYTLSRLCMKFKTLMKVYI